MSRKPKPAPAEAQKTDTQAAAPAPVAPDPAITPQVAPETTGAASAPASAAAEAAAAPVEPISNPAEDHSQKRGPDGYAVEVTGPAKGRWRIGRKFGPEPVVIAANELTEADLRALADDPELSMKLVEVEA